MDKVKKLIGVILGSAGILLLTAAPVLAFDGAILSEIKISSKDNYSYKITLITNKDVRIQKNVTSDNKIVIDLDNTRTAESVNTIYNNSPEIDNVIVQPVSNNKVRVFIEGLNISSSKVVLDSRSQSLNLADETVPLSSASIDNNNVKQPEAPKNVESTKVEDITPVINLSDYPITQKDVSKTSSAPAEDNIISADENNLETEKTAVISGAMLKKIFSKQGFDWFLRIFAVIFIIIGAIKILGRQRNVIVELSSENLKLKELELYRAANDRKELLSKSLGSNFAKENQADKKAYGANSYHGIKEYQNSQIPPSKLSRPVDINEMKISPRTRIPASLEKDLQKSPAKQGSSSTPLTSSPPNNAPLKRQQSPVASAQALQTKAPAANKTQINQKEIKTARTQAENIQFLETMASIYQKSGRNDLAQNIKQSILKSKTA